MKRGEIRRKTVLIISRGGEYLVGLVMGGPELRWSTSPWDAWQTRDRDAAREMCRKTGGDALLFNPIIGRTMKWNG